MAQTNGRSRAWLGWAVFLGCTVGVIALGLLATSINERRAERRQAAFAFLTPVDEWEADNAKWGVSFPRQYGSWEAT
jgi:hypothetical protein